MFTELVTPLEAKKRELKARIAALNEELSHFHKPQESYCNSLLDARCDYMLRLELENAQMLLNQLERHQG